MQETEFAIQPDLTVCTSFRKPNHLLRNMLTSVYQAADPVSLEVIIVDMSNGKGKAIHNEFPEAIIYDNPTEERTAQAWNRAMELSTGRYIALWEHDVIAKPDSLTKLLTFLDDTPDVGIAAPRIINAYGGTEPSCRNFHTLFSIIASHTSIGKGRLGKSILKKHIITHPGSSRTMEVDWLCSGLHVIRREVFEEIGLLDEKFELFFEEIDYYTRAKKRGWHNFYYPEAEAIHTRPKKYHYDLSEAAPFFSILKTSCRYFLKKWFLTGDRQEV